MSHNATDVRLNITASVGQPTRATMKVHAPCLTGTIDTITKIGTEDIGMTETTPIVWKGQLYRFENLRTGNWNNTHNCTNTSPGEGRRCTSYLRFRKQSGPPAWRTGEVVTSPFGEGAGLGCAVVDEATDRVHTFASYEGDVIGTWSSDGLSPESEWKHSIALQLPAGLTAFNTAVSKGLLPDGSETYAMLIEVGGMPGGFNIIVALSTSLDGPWELGATAMPGAGAGAGAAQAGTETSAAPAKDTPPHSRHCHAPSAGGYCSLVDATPTHAASGVLQSGTWPEPTLAGAERALEKICSGNSKCAAFGLGTDAKTSKAYQMYRQSPTVLQPLPTPDWMLYYPNATCCQPPAPPAPVKPARVFGPGSCPALRYDAASGYWHMLWTPNPTVSPNGGYRTWQIYAARSKTLSTGSWERSPLNPVMVADAFDRQIHNTAIRVDEQGWAGTIEGPHATASPTARSRCSCSVRLACVNRV